MLLDIFVPFWGDPRLLQLTVHSVLEQRNRDWRLTIVDDAYPDPAVAEFCTGIEDERVRYIRHEENVGITANYASCRDIATEELLMFLGCDDLLHPGFVDVVRAAHAAFPDAAVIQPGVDVIDEHGRAISPQLDRVKRRIMSRASERQELRGEDLAVSLLHGNWLYWPSLVFRRERVQAFDFREGLPIIQDVALVLDMVHAGDSLVLDPEVCFSYRRHTASASSASIFEGTRFQDDRRYFAIAAEQARERGWRRAERAARTRWTSRAHALSLLPAALRTGRVGTTGRLLTHAFHP